ncbi:MAG: flagellar hook-associated protein FlgK [Desulfomonilia bacterium]
MPGLGGALDIARWSMYSSQLAIQITSHNIANANTEGYSRQSLRVEANNPITMGPGQIGSGVRSAEVMRQYDAFINEQVSQKKSEYSYWNAKRTAMEEIETIFNESEGYGINDLMGEFWNAWSDLANNPDGIPQREALLAKTENLIQHIRDVDYNLRFYQRHLDSSIRGSVDQINTIIEQIADLNNSISSVEIDGLINANDLRDRRELLLEQLSEYMDISYYEEENSGHVMVYILGGTPLVLGKDSYELSTERDLTTGFTNILWNDSSGRTVDITHRLDGGKISGWVDVRDSDITSYIETLNTLSRELVWQVNALHAEGVGLSPVTSLTGTVEISQTTDDLGTDFLFSDRFNSGGSFEIVVYDDAGNVAHTYRIDPAGVTVQDLIDEINAEAAAGGSEISASLSGGVNGFFQIQAAGNFSFAIKKSTDSESSNALAILGVNTFFAWDEQTGAPLDDMTQTIGLNAVLSTNPQFINAGYLDSDGMVAPGQNEVARFIFSLQDALIPNIGGSGADTTMDAFYSAFIAEVGVDVQNAVQNEKFNDTLLSQYTRRKEAITGVNLDNEMAEILKFQHLYQAAAKLISITDEMMETLLSIK